MLFFCHSLFISHVHSYNPYIKFVKYTRILKYYCGDMFGGVRPCVEATEEYDGLLYLYLRLYVVPPTLLYVLHLQMEA